MKEWCYIMIFYALVHSHKRNMLNCFFAISAKGQVKLLSNSKLFTVNIMPIKSQVMWLEGQDEVSHQRSLGFSYKLRFLPGKLVKSDYRPYDYEYNIKPCIKETAYKNFSLNFSNAVEL